MTKIENLIEDLKGKTLVEVFLEKNPLALELMGASGTSLQKLENLPWPVPARDISDRARCAFFMTGYEMARHCVDGSATSSVGDIFVGYPYQGICYNIDAGVCLLDKLTGTFITKILGKTILHSKRERAMYNLREEISEVVLDSFNLRETEGPLYNVYISGVLAAKVEADDPGMTQLLRDCCMRQWGPPSNWSGRDHAAFVVNTVLRLIWIERFYGLSKNV